MAERPDQAGPAVSNNRLRDWSLPYRPDRVIAKPRATAGAAELAACEQHEGVRCRSDFRSMGRLRLLELAPTDTPLEAVERLQASGLYEYVEPDYLRTRHALPNDPRFGEQWAHRNTGQQGGRSGADVSAVAAWDVRSSAGSVIVAVLDSGIRSSHEDLAANMWVNPGEIPGNGIDDDGNGYVDDVHGINSLVELGAPGSGDPYDDVGHGTAVAGALAAVGNNGRGIAGIAWNAKIMALKFDDRDGGPDGSSWVSREVACIDYAVAHGAKVINVSYGGTYFSQAEYDAIERARDHGVIVVASAGNQGLGNETALSYPASHLLDNVISVGSTGRQDELSFFSTYGGFVDLAAPGDDILTCTYESDTAYAYVRGTSFSSPLVAGAVALLRAQFPEETPRGLINRLLRSVDVLPALSGKVTTSGRMNVARALNSTSNRPFNDDFANRSVVAGDSLLTRAVSTGATSEANEPVHVVAGGKSLWWSWVAPRSGTLVVDTLRSEFDTTLAVYTGEALAQLALVASNDDAPGRTTSWLSVAVTQGTTYHFAVDGKNGASGFVSLGIALQPPNDHFASAEVLTGVSTQTTGNNINATLQPGELRPGSPLSGNGATVWYRWVAPRASWFTVAVDSDSFQPVVAIYRGTSVSNLVSVGEAAEDVVSFEAMAGVTYYIAIDSNSPSAGVFELSLLEAAYAVPLGRINSGVATRPDGSLTLLNDSGYLFGFYADAEEGWVRKLRGGADANIPVFAPDGTIYATTTSGLFAVAPDRSLKWEKLFDEGISGAPALAADGTIYAHADDGRLYAYNAKGQEKWRTSVPGMSYASPSIGADGTIYLGSDDGYVYAIAPLDGSVKWRFNTGAEIHGSVALGSDDTLYVGNIAGKFFAIAPSGAQRWVYTASDGIWSSAAIAADGTLYFGAYDKKLYALNANGGLRWTYATEGEIQGSAPAVGSDGTIYIGSYDKKLHAVTSTGQVKQVYPTNGIIRSSPSIFEEAVVFGSEDRNLYFVYTGTELADSPWPMHRQNPARTGRRALMVAPSIETQPTSRAVAIGSSTTLTVGVSGGEPLAFQWYLNGTAIAGAIESTYTIVNAAAAHAGQYTVVVTNAEASVTSSAAVVSVVEASNLGRIVNLSARAVAGSGDKTLIVGFVVGGGQGSKQLLIRGAGASLALDPFFVPGTLGDPKITVYENQTAILTNDDWGNDAQVIAVGSQVGAFKFKSDKDAALVATVTPRDYSAHITASSGNGSGVALAEFYDATQAYGAGASRLINISARAQVGRGADVLIVGFVIAGDTPCKVLIRGVGPRLALAPFNVGGVLANPRIELRNAQHAIVAENDDWGSSSDAAELEAAMKKAGAFALASDSKDAAMVVTLQPGLYSATVSGVGDTTGVALAEVYQIE